MKAPCPDETGWSWHAGVWGSACGRQGKEVRELATHKIEYDGYAGAGHDGDAAAAQMEGPALEAAPEQDAQQDGRGICTGRVAVKSWPRQWQEWNIAL